MRTPTQLRITALIAYAVSLACGVGVAYLVHVLLGNAGRFGFEDFNPGGVVEGFSFVIAFGFIILAARELARLPVATLLSLGLIAPPSAARAAQPINSVENPSSLDMQNEISVLKQNGRPVGIVGGRNERARAWEDVPKISGEAAVTELRDLLSHTPLVAVVDGDEVHGIITQEMYLAGLKVYTKRKNRN